MFKSSLRYLSVTLITMMSICSLHAVGQDIPATTGIQHLVWKEKT